MRKALFGILLAVAVAGTMTACDSGSLKNETKEMGKGLQKDFDRQKLDIMYQVAQQSYQVGDYDKCREQLKAMRAVSAPYAPMHVLAGRLELEGGNLEVAAAELKQALTIDGGQAEAMYLLGVVYQRWQKFDTAADYYQQACDKKPGEALYVLAVAEMRITLGQLDQAKQLLEDKMLYFEQSAAMRVALARIAELQGDKAEASNMYREATLLLPEDKNIRWNYALALSDQGKYAEAARILEDLRHDPPTLPPEQGTLTHPDPDAAATAAKAAAENKVSLLLTLGDCYLSLKRPLDARDCFQEIIGDQPDNVTAYLSLGKACLMTNDLATTAAAAQKALRFEPDNVQAMLLQAAVLQKQEKWSASLDQLNTAARLAPRNATVLCMAGIGQLQLGRKDAAIASFEQAVAIDPHDAWAVQLLGQVKPEAVPVIKPVPAAPTTPAAAADAGKEETPASSNAPASLGEPAPAVTNAQPGGQ